MKSMCDTKEIRVPTFTDDLYAGRVLAPFPLACRFIHPPLNLFTDKIVIENETLFYKGSKVSYRADKSFELQNITKILVIKTLLTPWDKEHKIKPDGRHGTDIALFLVDIDGEKHVLIPRFMINTVEWGKWDWDRFMSELCAYTGLPLEEIERKE